MPRKKYIPAVLVALMAAWRLGAAADGTQVTQPDTASRPHAEVLQSEETAGDGYQMGGFVVQPQAGVSGIYDSNIFATRTDEVEDGIALFAPALSADSTWSRHKLDFDLGGAFARYNTNNDENYDDYWASTDGRYDLSETANVFGGLSYAHEHEERGSPQDERSGNKPTVYDSSQAHAGVSQDWGAFGLRLGGTYEDLSFDDAGSLDNSDRDRVMSGAGGRLTWRFHPQYGVYGQGVWDRRNYDQQTDDNGYERDSQGYRAGVGMLATFTNQLKGEAYLGYLRQDYDDPRFGDVRKPDYAGNLKWRPTPRTVMRADIERSLEETTLAGSSGYMYTSLSGSVQHKLTPRMNINVAVSAADADYQDVSRNDRYYSARLGMRYYLTPRWYLGAEYRVLVRDSNIDEQVNSPASPQELDDYARNQFFLNLGTLLYPAKPGPWWDLPSGQSLTVAAAPGDGFYAGAQIGRDSLNLHTRGGRDQGFDEGEFSDTGTSGGLFAGYGLSRKRWYVGVEAEYDDSNTDIHHSKAKSLSRTMVVSKGDSYGLALRGGYRLATGPLLYLRAGAQRAQFDSHYTVNARPDAGDDDQATQTGLRLGVGADIPAGDSLFVRLDYSQTRYDDFKADIVDALGQAQTERFRPREDLFRVGLGWRWGRNGERRATRTIDYNGLYAGAHIGQGALQSDTRGLHNDGNTTPADPGPFRFVGDFGDDSAATGGVFFGYGYSYNRYYLGLEGELEDSNADWSHAREPGGRDFSVEKMETWGASVRGGYVLDNGTLLYARAGRVRTRFNTTWVKGNNALFAVDRDDRKSGNRVGVGAELPFSRNAFVRLDYTYTNYSGYNFVTSQAAADSMEFDNTESLFRLGLGVRF